MMTEYEHALEEIERLKENDKWRKQTGNVLVRAQGENAGLRSQITKLKAENERLKETNEDLLKGYGFMEDKIEKLREAWKKIKCKYSDVGCGVGGEHTWQCELAQQVLKETE